MRRPYAIVGGLLGVLGLSLLVINQQIEVAVTESYSPGFRSASAAEAARRGVLLQRVAVRDPLLGPGVRVHEAWVEDQQQIYYRWLFLRRDSLLHRPQLVVSLEPQGAGCTANPARIAFSDGRRLAGHGCDFLYGPVSAPFPREITLRLQP